MRYVEVNGVRLSAIGVGTWQFGAKEWGYGEDYARRTAAPDHRPGPRSRGQPGRHRRDLRLRGVRAHRGPGHRRAPRPGLRGHQAVPGPAHPAGGRVAGHRVRRPAQGQHPGPVPGALAQPVRAQRAHHARACAGSSRSGWCATWGSATSACCAGGPPSACWARRCCPTRCSTAWWPASPTASWSPYAQSNDRLIIAYSPLAQGLLGGRYDVDHPPPPGVRTNNPLFLPDNLERAAGLLTALREIAGRHGATPAQVALAWVIRRPNVVAIPGASSVAQLEANVAAADLELSDDDDARLTDESDRFEPTRGVAALPGLIAGPPGRQAGQAGRGGGRAAAKARGAGPIGTPDGGLRPVGRSTRGLGRAHVERVEGGHGRVEHAGRAAGHGHRGARLVGDEGGQIAGRPRRPDRCPAPPARRRRRRRPPRPRWGSAPGSGTPASWARASPPPCAEQGVLLAVLAAEACSCSRPRPRCGCSSCGPWWRPGWPPSGRSPPAWSR